MTALEIILSGLVITVVIVSLWWVLKRWNRPKEVIHENDYVEPLQPYPAPEERDARELFLRQSIREVEKRTSKDDTAELQAKFDAVGNERTATIDLEGRVWNTTSTVYYRLTTNSQRLIVKNGRIHGAEQTFDLIAPDPKIKHMRIGYTSDDNNLIKYTAKLDVDNVVFRKGRNQLILANQRGSKITNCAFEIGVRGVLAVFVQHGVIDNCQFQFHDVEAIALRTGVSDGTLMESWGIEYDENNDKWFENPNSSNSQCNRFTVRDTWVFCQPNQRAGLRVQGSDGVTFENVVTEGADPWYSYYVDSRGSTTVDTVNIIRPHIEHGATEALMYFREMRNIYIDKLRSQIPGNLVMDVVGNTSQVVMDNLCYIPWDNGSFRCHYNTSWIFRDMVQNTQNLKSWSRWATHVPKEVLMQRGANLIAFGSDGFKFGSFAYINGRVKESYQKMKGDQLIWGDVKYWFRKQLTTIFK